MREHDQTGSLGRDGDPRVGGPRPGRKVGALLQAK
jgi:hypothetical protein